MTRTYEARRNVERRAPLITLTLATMDVPSHPNAFAITFSVDLGGNDVGCRRRAHPAGWP
jgi:hypothetical protein